MLPALELPGDLLFHLAESSISFDLKCVLSPGGGVGPGHF